MISERLNKRENEVMGAVFLLADGKERFLLFPYELLSVLPPRAKYDEETLDRALRALELDGYFDLIVTERKGEPAYVVHMREAGKSFRRNDLQRRRTFFFRLAVTLLCGVLSALVGILIKSILT